MTQVKSWKPEELQSLLDLAERYKKPGNPKMVDWLRIERDNPPEWKAIVASGRGLSAIRARYGYHVRPPTARKKKPAQQSWYLRNKDKQTRLEQLNAGEGKSMAPMAVAGKIAQYCPICGAHLAAVNAALNL